MTVLSSFLSTTGNRKIIHKILFLHIPILFALYILTDNNTYYNDDNNNPDQENYRHHLAVFTALQRHPPSARIFRCLLEFVLLGLCTSWSIYVWEGATSKDVLGRLLFDVPYTLRHTIHDSDCDGNDGNDGNDGSIGVDSNTAPTEVEMVSFLNTDHGDSNITPQTKLGGDIEYKDNPSSAAQTTLTDDDEAHNDNDCHVRSPFQKQYRPQPPSAIYVCNASLDILLLVFITLFLFTISSSAGGLYIDQTKSQSIVSRVGDIAAHTFPLLLFMFLAVRTILPWTRTKRYIWTVLTYTVGAPAYEVTFRDGFIGDILTSMVRPMQDLTYTAFYISMGLQGWWTVHNTNTDTNTDTNNYHEYENGFNAAQPAVERSWLLHTIIFPTLTLSPLWWRFCQTLRQTYVTRNRWPYLGNAAKYYVAAQVAVLAVYEPEIKETWGWKMAAVSATLYQIWWDVFMDWELFECAVVENEEEEGKGAPFSGTMPKKEVSLKDRLVRGLQFRLRRDRLYRSKSMYFGITIVNIVLRFGWTLTFVPERYLSASSGMLIETFTGMGGDLKKMVGPVLAAAEIVRRTLWGFLRLELEVLKIDDKGIQKHLPEQQQQVDKDLVKNVLVMGDDVTMKPMSVDSSVESSSVSKKLVLWSDISASSDVHVLWELCVYATAFTSMGIIAAYHRHVY